METPNFESRRKHPRHTLRDSVSVVEQGSDLPLGVVVNLSQEGIMLVNSQPLQSDSLYQIRLNISNGVIQGVDDCTIDMGIDCLWTNPAEGKASMYWAGCQIIDISDEAAALMQKLIRAVSQ
jgi:hypothetical protein